MEELDRFSRAVRSFELEAAQESLTPDSAANLSVYAKAYLVTLHQALSRCYPVTQRLIGSQNFRFFARQFIQDQPPQTFSIDHFGEDFPEYLASESRIQRSQPVLPFVAKLDWFHHHVLAPEQCEINLPSGLAEVYSQLVSGETPAEPSFGEIARHRLVRDSARRLQE